MQEGQGWNWILSVLIHCSWSWAPERDPLTSAFEALICCWRPSHIRIDKNRWPIYTNIWTDHLVQTLLMPCEFTLSTQLMWINNVLKLWNCAYKDIMFTFYKCFQNQPCVQRQHLHIHIGSVLPQTFRSEVGGKRNQKASSMSNISLITKSTHWPLRRPDSYVSNMCQGFKRQQWE